MRFKRLVSLVACFVLGCGVAGAFAGCSGREDNGPPPPEYDITSDTLYVKKVSGLNGNFVMGMDASTVISLENAGVKYYDYDGNEADVFKTLAESGINTVRVRVWNDPYDENGNGYGGGNCDIDKAVAIGKRVTEYGMKLMVDFHYSDFWADPNKQMAPKAWKGLDADDKADKLYAFTKECLQKLKDAEVNVNIVQVGNETNGKISGIVASPAWLNICKLMSGGSKAVREVYPKAMVAVHFANPEKPDNYRNYAEELKYYGVDYDIFASSYYPYWHGTLDNLSKILNEIAGKYGKKVMVAETAYVYTDDNTDTQDNTVSSSSGVDKFYPFTVQGQANSVRDTIQAVAKMKNGLGVCYWEGTWISVAQTGADTWEKQTELWEQYGCGWASSYSVNYDPDDAGKYYGGCAVDNQAMFGPDGKPLESLKVFALSYKGNTNVEKYVDALDELNIMFDLDGTKNIKLPATIDAIMNDDSRVPRPVTWDITEQDYETMYNGGANKYTYYGTVEGSDETAVCHVTLLEYNFLKNYSFEEDGHEDISPEGWKVDGALAGSNKNAWVTHENPRTGKNAFHWWASDGNAKFSLEQTVKLQPGKYKFTVFVMGSIDAQQDIYSYVKKGGEQLGKATIVKKGYTDNPEYWVKAEIEFTIDAECDVTVGISVDCASAGTWGDIDDIMLNLVS